MNMFTPTPRRSSHLHAARRAAARLRRSTAALAAVTCTLLASAAAIPAASAASLVRDPPGGAPLVPLPAPTVRVVTVGMAGWQITLITLGAALVAAIAAVFLDRILAGRRTASAPTA